MAELPAGMKLAAKLRAAGHEHDEDVRGPRVPSPRGRRRLLERVCISAALLLPVRARGAVKQRSSEREPSLTPLRCRRKK